MVFLDFYFVFFFIVTYVLKNAVITEKIDLDYNYNLHLKTHETNL